MTIETPSEETTGESEAEPALVESVVKMMGECIELQGCKLAVEKRLLSLGIKPTVAKDAADKAFDWWIEAYT